MTEIHEPTLEFVSRLEWQVRSTLSRRDRFSIPTRRPTRQVVKMAALILISVFCGAAGVATADQIQESRAREILISQINIEFQLAEVRLQLLRNRVAEIRNQFETGLVNEDALKTTMLELRAAEIDYTRLQIDREEIMLSGLKPQQRMSAPMVGGRDFVTERLELELALAAEERELVEARLEKTMALAEQGLVHVAEVKEQEASVMSLMQQMNYLKTLYDLRQQFIDEELSREEVEHEALLAEAQSRLDYVALEVARARLVRAEELFQQGAIRESEMVNARMIVMIAQLKLQDVLLRIEQLRTVGGDPPPM